MMPIFDPCMAAMAVGIASTHAESDWRKKQVDAGRDVVFVAFCLTTYSS
jgi:hypothetical protein